MIINCDFVAALSIGVESTNQVCYNTASGSIKLTPSGGSGGYSLIVCLKKKQKQNTKSKMII